MYGESQKKACAKYYVKNREKINEYSAKCMKEKYQTDPEYRAKKLQQMREYQERIRQSKINS